MGLTAEQVIVTVDARMARLRAEVQQSTSAWERGMARIRGSAADTEVRSVRSIRNIAGSIGLIGVAAGTIAGARAFLNLADTAKTLEAQLRLATRESGSFVQAQEDVRRIASQTRSGLQETATLYATFQRNARELGITQEQAARATQSVSQAFLISGASAAEAAGGLRQFLQGVQSGTLRGEELNSVLENAPRLARLLADSLGVTIGELRRMGQEGELTGDKLIAALTERRFTDQLDAEFRELPVTFGQAMTQISNAALIAFGAFDRGGQFSQALANFATQGAESFSSIEADAEHSGAQIRATMEALADVFGPMVGGAENAFGLIRVMADSLAADVAAIFAAWDSAAEGLRETAIHALGAIGGVNPALSRQFLPGADPVAPGFRSRQRQELRARTENSGIIAAWGDATRPRTTALPPRQPSAGGRRRAGGGGRARARRPELTAAQQRDAFELENFTAGLGEAPDIVAIPEAELARLIGETLPQIDGMMKRIAESTPDLGSMLSTEDAERIERFQEGFNRELSSGLAQALVYGENLGDVLENTFKRAAAALIESGLMQLLTGTGFGGKGGAGGVGAFISTAIGSIFGGGRALGGPVSASKMYLVGERGPELFRPQGAGTIIPQGRALSINDPGRLMPAGGGAPQAVTIYVQSTGDFEAKVGAISGNVAVQVVQAATPGIVRTAGAETMRAASRRRLNQ